MRSTVELKRIRNIEEGLSASERLLRRRVIEEMVNTGAPFHVGAITERERSDLKSIVKKGFFVVVDDEIVYSYPVSGMPTAHRVTLADGRCFHAMCGIDALGSSFLFRQDTEINSCCAVSGDPIMIRLKDGKIEEHSPREIQVIHVDLTAVDNWAASC